MDLFSRNDAKKLCSILQNVFERENFYSDLLNASYNELGLFYDNIGHIIEYYIRTRDTKTNYSVDDFIDKVIPSLYSFNGQKDIERQTMNTFTKGFVTHSCNGAFRENIVKNGLGSEKNRDLELEDKLQYLESVFGKSDYLNQQKNTYDEVYLTTPGATSVYYATAQSPERLFLGILKQERDNAMPIKVGESQVDYYKRLISTKLSTINCEDKDKVVSVANEVIDKFFSQKPIMVFIPISSKKYNLKVSMSHIKDNSQTDIMEYIENNVDKNISQFYSHQQSGWGTNNLDDLVAENVLIPSKKLGILQIPNGFDFLQLRAKNIGLKNGELIDYFTGEKVQEKVTEEDSVTLLNDKNRLQEEKRNLRRQQFQKRSDQIGIDMQKDLTMEQLLLNQKLLENQKNLDQQETEELNNGMKM